MALDGSRAHQPGNRDAFQALTTGKDIDDGVWSKAAGISGGRPQIHDLLAADVDAELCVFFGELPHLSLE